MVGGREMGRVGIESRKKRREFMYSRKRGWRWSHRWQDEKGFSSLLTGLLANNTQDDKRQNGHPQLQGPDTQLSDGRPAASGQVLQG